MEKKLYSELTDEIKTGDILAWKNTKIDSFFDFILFLYRKLFGVEYTHVGFALVLGDRWLLFEATPPVIRLYPISLTDDFYYVNTGLNLKSKHIDIMLKHLGKKYGFIDVFFGLLGIKRNNSSYFCSELVMEFLDTIGYLEDTGEATMPQTLMDRLVNEKGLEVISVKVDKGNLDAV